MTLLRKFKYELDTNATPEKMQEFLRKNRSLFPLTGDATTELVELVCLQCNCFVCNFTAVGPDAPQGTYREKLGKDGYNCNRTMKASWTNHTCKVFAAPAAQQPQTESPVQPRRRTAAVAELDNAPGPAKKLKVQQEVVTPQAVEPEPEPELDTNESDTGESDDDGDEEEAPLDEAEAEPQVQKKATAAEVALTLSTVQLVTTAVQQLQQDASHQCIQDAVVYLSKALTKPDEFLGLPRAPVEQALVCFMQAVQLQAPAGAGFTQHADVCQLLRKLLQIIPLQTCILSGTIQCALLVLKSVVALMRKGGCDAFDPWIAASAAFDVLHDVQRIPGDHLRDTLRAEVNLSVLLQVLGDAAGRMEFCFNEGCSENHPKCAEFLRAGAHVLFGTFLPGHGVEPDFGAWPEILVKHRHGVPVVVAALCVFSRQNTVPVTTGGTSVWKHALRPVLQLVDYVHASESCRSLMSQFNQTRTDLDYMDRLSAVSAAVVPRIPHRCHTWNLSRVSPEISDAIARLLVLVPARVYRDLLSNNDASVRSGCRLAKWMAEEVGHKNCSEAEQQVVLRLYKACEAGRQLHGLMPHMSKQDMPLLLQACEYGRRGKELFEART